MFTETSHHIYYPHTKARGHVNLKDLIAEHYSADENSADGKSSKFTDRILQHKACKLEEHKSKMRKAEVCVSCTYSTAVPLQTQTTPPAASQKPGQQLHRVKPTLPPSRLTSTEADNSRTWSPRSEAPHPPSLPTGSSSRHRHKLLTSGNQFSQKLDITNSMLQLTGKSAPQMLLYNRILKTPSKTIGVQTR